MLSAQSLKTIDAALAKYPVDQKQSAVMAALVVAQEEKGHLSTEVMDFVAAYLGMAPVAVYEVASFYAMYDLAPVGKHKLCVCTNLPCALSGAVEAAAAVTGFLLISAIAEITPLALAFSAGAMAFVTFSELLPDAFSGAKKRVPAIALAAGIIATLLIARLLTFY